MTEQRMMIESLAAISKLSINMYAFTEGMKAAKNGTHIANCYPFTLDQGILNELWIGGYNGQLAEMIKANKGK